MSSGCQEKKMISFKDFIIEKAVEEEAPANSAGGGNIAGIGVGPQGEPGITPKAKRSYKKRNQAGAEAQEVGLELLRRKTPMMEESDHFAGNRTFKIPSSKFHEMRMQKRKGSHWKKYIGEDEHGMTIREYANKNPKKPIILQDEATGAMIYARYGGKND